IVATIPFGEGLLAAWVFQGKAPPREQVESAAFLADVGLSLVFYAPAMLAYWFAPMLVVWHGTGAAKALFFSLTACLFNWRAFCAYAVAAVLLFFTLFASLSLAASLLVAASGAPPNAALVVILPAFGVFLAVLVASVYASYCDVFDTGANGKSPTIPA
ncbi:MAG: BPSS1780 family membrane protein, partial [Pseudomonadota bacterium]